MEESLKQKLCTSAKVNSYNSRLITIAYCHDLAVSESANNLSLCQSYKVAVSHSIGKWQIGTELNWQLEILKTIFSHLKISGLWAKLSDHLLRLN